MKKLFSGKLYLDGLSKTKVFGIISIILTTVLSAFVAIVAASDTMVNGYFQVVDTNLFAIPITLILLLAPFSVYLQFNFLNKRASSDFYHSLPFTRTQLCLSYFASALTWMVTAVATPIAVCTVVYAVCPSTGFEPIVPFLCFIGYFGAAFLLMALMLIAMSLTGTAVSNILVFGIITLFFRLIFALFSSIFEELVPICDMNSFLGSFFSLDFFLPLQLLAFEDLFTNIGSLVYAYILGILCVVGGTALFIRRQSESADKSAVSRVFQNIFRCAVSIPTAILTVLSFADIVSFNGALYLNEAFILFLFLIITLIVYFLYEIITTKGVSTLVKILPQLGIVFAAGLAFWGVLEITEAHVYSFEPTSDELKSINLSLSEDSVTSYEALKTSDIIIDDPEALKLASKTLSDSINASRNNTFYNGHYVTYESLDFTTKDGKTVRRNLKMSTDDYNTLISAFLSSDEYHEAQLSLPKDDEILSTHAYLYSFSSSDTDELSTRIWSCFKDEYNTLSDEDKLAIKSFNVVNDLGSITVNGTLNGRPYYSSYTVCELTPKTAALMLSQLGSSTQNDEIRSAVEGFLNAPSDYMYFSVSAALYNIDNGAAPYSIYYDHSIDFTEQTDALKELLSALSPYFDSPAVLDESFVCLSIYFEDGQGFDSYSISFAISQELYDKLIDDAYAQQMSA